MIIGHGISNEIAIKNMITLTKDVVEAGMYDLEVWDQTINDWVMLPNAFQPPIFS